MTEELEKEVEEKGIKYADSLEYTVSDEEGYSWSQVEEAYEKGALDFAESREKRIVELEAQIEKMKECANCPVWLLNQSEKNCKDCKYKEALILLRR